MRTIVLSSFFLFLASDSFGQTPDPPLSDARLSIHTLLREDIFAGWRSDNIVRFTRGEKNIDRLLKLRPKSKADLIAWKGGATLYRAVLAHESKKSDESKRLFKKSIELFAEARKLNSQSVGVAAVSGGSLVVLADRLPKEYRKIAWSEAYNNYQVLWKQQEPVIDKLPMHLRGELLGGLAQSSQRTGRKKELDQFLDKILETLPNTSYARVAKQWKKDPTIATKTSISCKSCHSAGRLKARIAKLNDK